MQSKKEIIINFIKNYSKKKRTWVLIVLFIIFIIYLFKPNSTSENIIVEKVEKIDLKQTIQATGQVTSNTDLNLSFNSSGIVKSLKVKVGDKVKEGQILANIDQGSQLASLTQARGALAAAKAKLQKTLEGSSNEEIAITETALNQAKITQDVLVKNAYSKLLNSTPEAVPLDGTSDYSAPTISGTYSLGLEGIIKIKTYLSTNGGSGFNISGLVSGSGTVTTTIPQPISNSGLYIKFSSTIDPNVSEWVINIPNKKAPDYLSNYNAYRLSLSESEATLERLKAELNLKKATARSSDIELAKAEVTSAEGQVQAAVSRYEDTLLRAPADGTITSVDLKLGELSEVQKPVMVLQDISNLYIEAKINESNIANVRVGQKVSMTFDAFGQDRLFSGSVIHVDPSAITNDGIVNYKIQISIDNLDKEIRTGMNSDIIITTAQKPNVLVVSKASLITKDGKVLVNLIEGEDSEDYQEHQITIGIIGDGNKVEVISGLTSEDSVAIVSK